MSEDMGLDFLKLNEIDLFFCILIYWLFYLDGEVIFFLFIVFKELKYLGFLGFD